MRRASMGRRVPDTTTYGAPDRNASDADRVAPATLREEAITTRE